MKYSLIQLLVIFLMAFSCRSNESQRHKCGFKSSSIDGPKVKQKLLEGREWVYQATLGKDTCFILDESFPLVNTADVFPFRFVVSDCEEAEMNFGIPLGGPFARKQGVTGACFQLFEKDTLVQIDRYFVVLKMEGKSDNFDMPYYSNSKGSFYLYKLENDSLIIRRELPYFECERPYLMGHGEPLKHLYLKARK